MKYEKDVLLLGMVVTLEELVNCEKRIAVVEEWTKEEQPTVLATITSVYDSDNGLIYSQRVSTADGLLLARSKFDTEITKIKYEMTEKGYKRHQVNVTKIDSKLKLELHYHCFAEGGDVYIEENDMAIFVNGKRIAQEYTLYDNTFYCSDWYFTRNPKDKGYAASAVTNRSYKVVEDF